MNALWESLPEASQVALVSWCELELALEEGRTLKVQALLRASRPDATDELAQVMLTSDVEMFAAWRSHHAGDLMDFANSALVRSKGRRQTVNELWQQLPGSARLFLERYLM